MLRVKYALLIKLLFLLVFLFSVLSLISKLLNDSKVDSLLDTNYDVDLPHKENRFIEVDESFNKFLNINKQKVNIYIE
jgi:hypothetical protein